MGKVINFPTKPTRDWAEIESTIRHYLVSVSAPPEMSQAVVARMKVFFEESQCTLTVNAALPIPETVSHSESQALVVAVNQAFIDFQRQVHSYSSKMLFERLKLEIELYQARAHS